MLDRESNIKILTTISLILGVISWFVQIWRTTVFGIEILLFSSDFSIWISIVALALSVIGATCGFIVILKGVENNKLKILAWAGTFMCSFEISFILLSIYIIPLMTSPLNSPPGFGNLFLETTCQLL